MLLKLLPPEIRGSTLDISLKPGFESNDNVDIYDHLVELAARQLRADNTTLQNFPNLAESLKSPASAPIPSSYGRETWIHLSEAATIQAKDLATCLAAAGVTPSSVNTLEPESILQAIGDSPKGSAVDVCTAQHKNMH